MTALPAIGYPSNAARTQGEMKTFFDDLLRYISERGGTGAGWVNQVTAATTNLGANTNRMLSFSGGVAITSFGTTSPGDSFPYLAKFAARTTITNGANLKIQGEITNGATVTFEVDDIVAIYWEGSNVWRLVLVAKADGLPMATPFGMRNRIINGGMAIDQRNGGASFSITSTPAYCLDRWWASATGANLTGQRTSASIDGPNRLTITGAASNTGFKLGQRLEAGNTADLASKPVTISVKLSATGLTVVNWEINRANSLDGFGTLASPTVTNVVTGGSFTISGTEATFKATFANAATVNGLELVFSTGAIGAGSSLVIGDVQMEAGKAATPFERRPIGIEIGLCQRYYCKGFPIGTPPGSGFTAIASIANSAGVTYVSVPFPVNMRTTPTVTVYNSTTGATGTWRDGGAVDVSITANPNATSTIFTGSGGSANAQIAGNWVAIAEL